jgi:predicted DNA-binding transcriptional regulator YafY
VLAILPAESRRKAEQSRVFAPDFGAQGYSKDQFDIVHRAVSAQQALGCAIAMKRETCRSVTYCRWGFFWGERWLLVTWCELREDYRCFRLDRCLEISATGRHFSERADRSLSDFLRKVRCEER